MLKYIWEPSIITLHSGAHHHELLPSFINHSANFSEITNWSNPSTINKNHLYRQKKGWNHPLKHESTHPTGIKFPPNLSRFFSYKPIRFTKINNKTQPNLESNQRPKNVTEVKSWVYWSSRCRNGFWRLFSDQGMSCVCWKRCSFGGRIFETEKQHGKRSSHICFLFLENHCCFSTRIWQKYHDIALCIIVSLDPYPKTSKAISFSGAMFVSTCHDCFFSVASLFFPKWFISREAF